MAIPLIQRRPRTGCGQSNSYRRLTFHEIDTWRIFTSDHWSDVRSYYSNYKNIYPQLIAQQPQNKFKFIGSWFGRLLLALFTQHGVYHANFGSGGIGGVAYGAPGWFTSWRGTTCREERGRRRRTQTVENTGAAESYSIEEEDVFLYGVQSCFGMILLSGEENLMLGEEETQIPDLQVLTVL